MREPEWLKTDRRYQQRHPRRRYRLRRPVRDEFAPPIGEVIGGTAVERTDGTVDPVKAIMARAIMAADAERIAARHLPAGMEAAVLVVHQAPGVRFRLPVDAVSRFIDMAPSDAAIEAAFGPTLAQLGFLQADDAR
jgi:hypothetical protein